MSRLETQGLLRPGNNRPLGVISDLDMESNKPAMFLLLAIMPFIIWVYLFFLHGGIRHPFWWADQRLDSAPVPEQWPSVVGVIPARDEIASVWPMVRSHLASDYPGAFRLILVDDHSSDGTAALARAAAGNDSRLTIVSSPPLAAGWSGKLWAVHHGIVATQQDPPDFLLLCDADIIHSPDTLRRLVCKAEAENLALTSLMARLDARGFWGGLLIPAFIYFFMKLYPFGQINAPKDTRAGAAGGCMLVRFDRLMKTGGIKAIGGALIDDCALGAQCKNTAPRAPIFLGLASTEVRSLRDNQSLGSVWQMVARTAYTQLGHSPVKLTGTVTGMALAYLLAPILLLTWPWHGHHLTAWLSLLTVLFMVISYQPILRVYNKPILSALMLPFASLLYTVMTIHSALRHWRGAGGQWKGRIYNKQQKRDP